MIRLRRAARPAALDAATAAALAAKYASDKSSVWNVDYIKNALLGSSNNKCAYCETKLMEEAKYVEVEHFRSKDDFPEKVVEWDNLLPSCKRCNGRKSNYNVETEGMIVNPYDIDPKAHLYMHNFRLRPRDDIGSNTIDALYLNDTDKLVLVRALVVNAVADSIEKLYEYLEEFDAGKSTTRQRNKIVRGLEKLLHESGSTTPYSATTATALLNDPHYGIVKAGIERMGLWAPLQALEDEAIRCALTR